MAAAIKDLIIIGSGPAALTAALYAARENLSVTVYESANIGGKLTIIPRIDNFPGSPGAGATLARTMSAQATQAGATITYGKCTKISPSLTATIDQKPIKARSILIATGTEPSTLAGLPPTENIHYCATCDAPLYKNQPLIVIGGGNSALQESLHLIKHASHLTIISRSPFRASPALQNKIKQSPKITTLENTDPIPAISSIPHAAIFIFIGNRPATTFAPPQILAPDGSISTNSSYMTRLPGIFAAGDVRQDSIKQALTAAAEGAAAALSIAKYLATHA
jgi:thioredoxin reductase (NADPH)